MHRQLKHGTTRAAIAIALALTLPMGAAAQTAAATPQGWFASGSAPGNYEMVLDTSGRRGGRASARIAYKAGDIKEFGTLMQAVDATPWRGKRVMMSGWMRSEEVDSGHLWMRVDASPKLTVAFDNMSGRAVQGSTGWTRYQVVLDVAKDAAHIAFGAFLVGKGRLWLDDLAFDTVEGHVHSTNLFTPDDIVERKEGQAPRRIEKSPQNFDFEAGGG